MAKKQDFASKVEKGSSGGGKDMVKVIVSVRSPKTGAYIFKEKVVHKDKVKEQIAAFSA
jgi:hypothetical protein